MPPCPPAARRRSCGPSRADIGRGADHRLAKLTIAELRDLVGVQVHGRVDVVQLLIVERRRAPGAACDRALLNPLQGQLGPAKRWPPGGALDSFVAASEAKIEMREGYEVELRAALATCTAPLQPGPLDYSAGVK